MLNVESDRRIISFDIQLLESEGVEVVVILIGKESYVPPFRLWWWWTLESESSVGAGIEQPSHEIHRP